MSFAIGDIVYGITFESGYATTVSNYYFAVILDFRMDYIECQGEKVPDQKLLVLTLHSHESVLGYFQDKDGSFQSLLIQFMHHPTASLGRQIWSHVPGGIGRRYVVRTAHVEKVLTMEKALFRLNQLNAERSPWSKPLHKIAFCYDYALLSSFKSATTPTSRL